MLVTPSFAEERNDVIVDVIRRAGFGHLVVAAPGLASTPIPFVIDDDLTTLSAHVARQNPITNAAPCDALVIVSPIDGYVTPSWYPSKAEHGRVVPTWNYEVVHLHGTLSPRTDAEWLRAQIAALTDVNERGRSQPWATTDAPGDFIDRQLRAITGLELSIERIVAKRKLSQNRPEADQIGVRAGLRAHGPRHHDLADAMER